MNHSVYSANVKLDLAELDSMVFISPLVIIKVIGTTKTHAPTRTYTNTSLLPTARAYRVSQLTSRTCFHAQPPDQTACSATSPAAIRAAKNAAVPIAFCSATSCSTCSPTLRRPPTRICSPYRCGTFRTRTLCKRMTCRWVSRQNGCVPCPHTCEHDYEYEYVNTRTSRRLQCCRCRRNCANCSPPVATTWTRRTCRSASICHRSSV